MSDLDIKCAVCEQPPNYNCREHFVRDLATERVAEVEAQAGVDALAAERAALERAELRASDAEHRFTTLWAREAETWRASGRLAEAVCAAAAEWDAARELLTYRDDALARDNLRAALAAWRAGTAPEAGRPAAAELAHVTGLLRTTPEDNIFARAGLEARARELTATARAAPEAQAPPEEAVPFDGPAEPYSIEEVTRLRSMYGPGRSRSSTVERLLATVATPSMPRPGAPVREVPRLRSSEDVERFLDALDAGPCTIDHRHDGACVGCLVEEINALRAAPAALPPDVGRVLDAAREQAARATALDRLTDEDHVDALNADEWQRTEDEYRNACSATEDAARALDATPGGSRSDETRVSEAPAPPEQPDGDPHCDGGRQPPIADAYTRAKDLLLGWLHRNAGRTVPGITNDTIEFLRGRGVNVEYIDQVLDAPPNAPARCAPLPINVLAECGHVMAFDGDRKPTLCPLCRSGRSLDGAADVVKYPRPTRYDCGEGVVLEWCVGGLHGTELREGWWFEWHAIRAHGAHATVLARTCYPSPEAAVEALEKWRAGKGASDGA